MKLLVKGIEHQKKPGYHNDGAGIYLQVAPGGSKSWVFRYKVAGRSREMGLGPLVTFGLAEARSRAKAARQQLADSLDPIDERRALRRRNAEALTFAQAAEKYIESHQAGWRNAKDAQQCRNTLATYAGPVIGSLPVASVNMGHVYRILDPIWRTRT